MEVLKNENREASYDIIKELLNDENGMLSVEGDILSLNQDEFDEYLKTMQIKGLGGTDFRPVFEKVDELIKNKEFRNLKGLIYFTDGYGVFPERKPDYDTAFVFVKDDYEIPDVPPWAIKLVLEQNDI